MKIDVNEWTAVIKKFSEQGVDLAFTNDATLLSMRDGTGASLAIPHDDNESGRIDEALEALTFLNELPTVKK